MSLESKCFRFLYLFVIVLALPLAACKSVPSDDGRARAAALRDAGFVQTEEGWQLNLALSALLFDTASDRLTVEDRDRIASVSRSLLGVGVDRLRLEGHTDNVGNADFNRALSQRRADAVAREFVVNGMPPNNITRQGFGFDKPIADNATAEGRAKNRRVVIIVPAF